MRLPTLKNENGRLRGGYIWVLIMGGIAGLYAASNYLPTDRPTDANHCPHTGDFGVENTCEDEIVLTQCLAAGSPQPTCARLVLEPGEIVTLSNGAIPSDPIKTASFACFAPMIPTILPDTNNGELTQNGCRDID